LLKQEESLSSNNYKKGKVQEFGKKKKKKIWKK
jgi:hypothetical protein